MLLDAEFPKRFIADQNGTLHLPLFGVSQLPVQFPGGAKTLSIARTVVDANYFSTLGIRTLAGRTFNSGDRTSLRSVDARHVGPAGVRSLRSGVVEPARPERLLNLTCDALSVMRPAGAKSACRAPEWLEVGFEKITAN